VKDIRTDGAGSYPSYLTVFNGILYFKASEDNSNLGLWRSDGTEAGTYKLTTDLHNPVNLKVHNDKLYFIASNITGGSGIGNYELWSWSETNGVTLVKEINPNPNFGIDFNPGSNFPEGFVEYNGILYFRAADDGYGTTLWQTDGTEAGTIVAPGQENFTYPDPVNPMYIMSFDFQVFNGSLYYPAGYEDDPAFEVYKLTSELIYTVTGGGYYCNGMAGLPVGLSGSVQGVIYTLYKNEIAQSPTVTGTGNAISFGNQQAGTYTIKATDANGTTTNMNGNAIILEGTVPVSVMTAPDQNGVCAGTSVTFSATPVNGGSAPTYQWFKNNEAVGSDQSTYEFIPDNNDNVYVQLTSSLSCVSGNPAVSVVTTMSVFTSLEPIVTISASYDTICGGSTVQYVAEAVNGGTTPSYQWYKNNEPVGANQPTFSYVTSWVNQITNDEVYVVMISSLTCVNSNPATSIVDVLTILPRPFVEVSIVADNTNVCGGNPVTITALPVHGGTNPTYYWNVNDNPVSTTNEPTFTYIPLAGDYIYVMLNSSLPCTQNDPATSNSIYMTVNDPVNPSVTISASENPVQAGVPVTFTPSSENGGESPAYEWFVNGTLEGNEGTYTYTPSNGDEVYVKMTSSLECVTAEVVVSNTIEMIVLTDYPNVAINPTSLVQSFNIPNGQATELIQINNSGPGALYWNASIEYLSNNEVKLVPEGPVSNGTQIGLSKGNSNRINKIEDKNRETVVLHYDGDNYDAIGLTSGGTFHVAARYPSSMTAQYTGYALQSLDVYINDAATSATLKIWDAGTTTTPGTLLHQQSFIGTGWLTIELSSPLELTGSDIWVGYVLTNAAGSYPAGCDAGPANANGDWISTDGSSWEHLSGFGLNYNWNIRANLYGNAYNWLTINPTSGIVEGNTNSNIEVHFDATGLENQIYTANILFSSNDPETPLVTIPVTMALTVGMDENSLSGIEVYPNPASGLINFKLVEGIQSISMYNAYGQLLKAKSVVGEMQIIWETSAMPKGSYIVEFTGINGKKVNKKVIIM